jgi:hypothetical protein
LAVQYDGIWQSAHLIFNLPNEWRKPTFLIEFFPEHWNTLMQDLIDEYCPSHSLFLFLEILLQKASKN